METRKSTTGTRAAFVNSYGANRPAQTAAQAERLDQQVDAFAAFLAASSDRVVAGSDAMEYLFPQGFDPNAWLKALPNGLIAKISVGTRDHDAPGGNGTSSIPNTARVYPTLKGDSVTLYVTDAEGRSAQAGITISYAEMYRVLSGLAQPQRCGWRAVPFNRPPALISETLGPAYNGETGVTDLTVTDSTGTTHALGQKRLFCARIPYDAARAFANPDGEARKLYTKLSGDAGVPSSLRHMEFFHAQYALVRQGLVTVETGAKRIAGIAQSILNVRDIDPNDQAAVAALAEAYFPVLQAKVTVAQVSKALKAYEAKRVADGDEWKKASAQSAQPAPVVFAPVPELQPDDVY